VADLDRVLRLRLQGQPCLEEQIARLRRRRLVHSFFSQGLALSRFAQLVNSIDLLLRQILAHAAHATRPNHETLCFDYESAGAGAPIDETIRKDGGRGRGPNRNRPVEPKTERGMRRAYREALEAARGNVIQLGESVVKTLRQALEAVLERDVSLAAEVLSGDADVQGGRRLIEQECIELIWRQQPVAGDLRAITAMLEIALDLDRIREYAMSLAKNAIKLNGTLAPPAEAEIAGMAQIVLTMLGDAMRAYSNADSMLADSVIARDKEVNALRHGGIERLRDAMQENSALVRPGTISLFVLQTLERAGDRARHIARYTKELLGTA
jgi:phosphate transport system protein